MSAPRAVEIALGPARARSSSFALRAANGRGREGPLPPQRDAPVGGQAVLEGVMMRGICNWAVAVRRPDGVERPGEVDVRAFSFSPAAARRQLWRAPLLRGVVALGESLAIGMRALGIAAAVQTGEEAEIPRGVWWATGAVSLLFAVGLFFVAPVGLVSLIRRQLGSSLLFWLVEGLLRTAIFLIYLLALSRLRELRRVLEYHGAEHKAIACYEARDELTPERAQRYPRLHPRCGTSFLLVVMVVAIFVFAPVGLPAWWVLVLTRILGVPVIAAVSFELIRWAARNRRRAWVRALMAPGLALQRLTTREPDLSQLAVAIAALREVLAREAPGGPGELVGVEVVA
jgi:uncharacterized protein YqhQ